MKIIEARALAKESTSYGYFDHGASVSVRCPKCQHDVVVGYHLHASDSKGKRLSKVDQLRQGVFEHLQWNCDDTTKLFEGVYK